MEDTFYFIDILIEKRTDVKFINFVLDIRKLRQSDDSQK